MHGQRNSCHLLFFIHQDDACLLIRPCRCEPYLTHHLIRCLCHEAAHQTECIYSDIKQCTTGKIDVKETIIHIIFFIASEIQLYHLNLSEFTG